MHVYKFNFVLAIVTKFDELITFDMLTQLSCKLIRLYFIPFSLICALRGTKWRFQINIKNTRYIPHTLYFKCHAHKIYTELCMLVMHVMQYLRTF